MHAEEFIRVIISQRLVECVGEEVVWHHSRESPICAVRVCFSFNRAARNGPRLHASDILSAMLAANRLADRMQQLSSLPS